MFTYLEFIYCYLTPTMPPPDRCLGRAWTRQPRWRCTSTVAVVKKR